jgi:hypothetical protein
MPFTAWSSKLKQLKSLLVPRLFNFVPEMVHFRLELINLDVGHLELGDYRDLLSLQ